MRQPDSAVKSGARLGWAFFLPPAVALCLGGLAVILLLPAAHATPQRFHQVIIELIAQFGFTNKTGELRLFWGCLAGACLVAVLLALLAVRRARRKAALGPPAAEAESPATPAEGRNRSLLKAILLLLVPNLMLLFITGRINLVLLAMCAVYVAVRALDEGMALKSAMLCVFSYYAVCGVVATVHLAGLGGLPLSDRMLQAVALLPPLLLAMVCAVKRDQALMDRLLLAFQCLVPLCLLPYLQNRYLYQGEVVVLHYPAGYLLIAGGGIIALLACAIIGVRRWRPGANVILLTSLIAILVYNSYLLPAQYFQTDTHHHGEQMIPWQQIVENGQAPYQDYAPASGLYPLVTGFVQNVLLGGATTAYPAALALVSAGFAVLTICLCAAATSREMCLAIAFFYSIATYNRQYLILPALLLLCLPKLIEKRHLWLPAWLLCCLAAGLYYPVYGAGLLVGTLPFGLVQLVALFTSGEFKACLKKPLVLALWAGALAMAGLCAPLLLRMARHVLLYSGQGVLADGISIFGAPVNDAFMPWLTAFSPAIRTALFYAFKFMLPVWGMLGFVLATTLYLAGAAGQGRRGLWQRLQHPAFFCFSAGAGVLAVAYSFTTIRQDYFTIIARAGPILLGVAGVFLCIGIVNYGHLILKTGPRQLLLAVIVGLCLFVYNNCNELNAPAPVGAANMNGSVGSVLDPRDDAVLAYAYPVPEGFVAIDDEIQANFPRLGPGFIEAGQLEHLYWLQDTLGEHIEAGRPIAHMAPGQLYYYPLNAKAAYTGTWNIAKDNDTQHAIIDYLERHPDTVGFEFTSFTHYVLFEYLAAQRGCVVVDDTLWMFPEAAAALDEERIQRAELPFYQVYQSRMELGNIAGSLGKSMQSLEPMFTQVDAALAVNGLELAPAAPVEGREADFLYLELEAGLDLAQDPALGRLGGRLAPNRHGEAYKLSVWWTTEDAPHYAEERSFGCTWNDGRLLLPMGANTGWLFGRVTGLKIVPEDGIDQGQEIVVKAARLLRYDCS